MIVITAVESDKQEIKIPLWSDRYREKEKGLLQEAQSGTDSCLSD